MGQRIDNLCELAGVCVVSIELQHLYRNGALVIWPPDEVRATVGALRQRYDPASQAICDAHITLTQPFRREPASEDLAAIEHVVAHEKQVEIDYGPVATFLPYPCVYLRVEPDQQIRTLRGGLHDLGMFNLTLPFSDPAEFIPHMSITDGYPDPEQTRWIVDALRGSEPEGAFWLSEIVWIRPDDQFHIEVVMTFALAAS